MKAKAYVSSDQTQVKTCVATMGEIKPTHEHLSDPYVLQLIEALVKRDDEIERLTAEVRELEGAINAAAEALEIGEGVSLTYYMDWTTDLAAHIPVIDRAIDRATERVSGRQNDE